MKKYFIIVSLIFCALNVFGQEKSNLVKLAETENSFARTVDEKGFKEGFLEFLADDGLLFRPTAVNGKESWRARPDSPASLSWYPVFVDASSAFWVTRPARANIVRTGKPTRTFITAIT